MVRIQNSLNVRKSVYVTRHETFGPNAQMTLLSKMTSKYYGF